MTTPIYFYKTDSLSNLKPNSLIALKLTGGLDFSLWVTDKTGIPYPLKDNTGGGGGGTIEAIINTDGNLTITGTTTKTINVSSSLLLLINSALQAGDNISELVNDANYITLADIPAFVASDYDLEDFTNAGADPYAHLSDLSTGITNLDYIPSPTQGIVTSDTGTDATIPLADGTNAGLLEPSKYAILENTSGTNTGDNATNTQYSGLADSKENVANKSDSYTTSSSITYVSGKALVEGLGTKANLDATTTLTPTVSGEPCRISFLADTKTTEAKTLVLYFHGSSETQDTPFTGLGSNITNKLIQEGYIVASSFAGGNAWGNQASQDDYYDLYAYINGLYNITRVVFIGQSMGGLASLNLLASNRISKCYAWYGVYPVTNLNEAYFNEGFIAPIEAAYGFTGSSNYAAATAGFDPQLTTTSLFAEKTYDMTASPDDTLIFKTTNSDLFKTKINSVAFRATVIQASGAHGDASHFLPNNVLKSFEYFPTNSVGTAGYIGKFGNYKDIFTSDIFQNGVNIGIGTVSPARKVHIKDNVGFYEVLRLESISSEAVVEMKDSAGVLTTFGTVLGDFYIGTQRIKHLTINRITGNATFSSTVTATSFNGSATLTGTPTAPTAAPGTTGNQIATLDYVLANSGANSGATSGTYTPTLTNGLNVTSTIFVPSIYTKIGNIVTVTVTIEAAVIAANSPASVTISLPFNRSTSGNDFVCGSGSAIKYSSNTYGSAVFKLKNNTTEVAIHFYPVASGGNTLTGTFSYSI